jgi:ABC-2 type transport system ATP-binding protein
LIRIEGLSKTYKVHKKEPGLKGSLKALVHRKWTEKHALKGVSLNVDEGEIVGLIGANGAGKTTLVKICSGIIHPTAGQVKVLGFTPHERANAFRRQISLIMGQKQQLWWDLPAADGLLLLREIYMIPMQRYKDTLDFLATTLGVKDLLTTQVRRLSLGERMKMELIAALIHDPRVFFLDEPTIGLDLTAQKAVRQFLLDYRAKHRPAMLLTSHYMEDIERLCERIVIIKEGEVIYDGGLKEVITRYATHKSVTARLARAADLPHVRRVLPAGIAEIAEADESKIKVKVLADRAADVSAILLKELPVVDLTIEDEDIGNIIEAIMRQGIQ